MDLNRMVGCVLDGLDIEAALRGFSHPENRRVHLARGHRVAGLALFQRQKSDQLLAVRFQGVSIARDIVRALVPAER